MNDERSQSVLEEWLKARDVTPEDVRRSAHQVMERRPRVRQRSRWWPFPVLYRRTRKPAISDTVEYWPSPIPAADGHTPTIIGRTQTMFSPAKALIAGALVFGIGGAMLIAQPFERPPVIPGAAADEPAAPVAVTATTSAGGCPGVETTESIGFIERTTGGYCNPTWDWSDDRLDGKVTFATTGDRYTDGSGLEIGMLALSFENYGGAWRMRPLPDLEFPGAPAVGAEVWVLDGEGGYEGLTAVLVVEGFTPHGFIIDGDLPPAPENASTR